MEHKKEEQLVYLKDLFFAPLHRWKAMFFAVLVFAALLGGFKGISSWNARKAARALQADPGQQIAAEKYRLDVDSLTAQLEHLQQNIKTKKLYMEESILMQLDPYNHYEAVLTLTVNTDYQIDPALTFQNPDKTELVTSGYFSLVMDNQVLQSMADAVASQPHYVKELITCNRPNSSTLQVRIKYVDSESAQNLCDIMAQHLTGSQALVTSASAAHTINILTNDVHLIIDPAVETAQQTARTALTSVEALVLEVQMQKSNLVDPAIPVASAIDVVKDAVKFAVVGGVIGVLLTVFAVWVLHIGSNKVYSVKTLTNRTGVKVLGSIRCVGKDNALDHLINKAEGRNCNNTQVQAGLLAANIRNRCANAKHLLIISDTENPAKTELIEALRRTLTGMHIDDCGSLLQDAAALAALADCDCVLMIKQCHLSLYSATEQEFQIITDSGKHLLGCVLLGG